MKSKKSKCLIAFLVLCASFELLGCRQGPSEEPPRYYQRELARMKKEEAKRAEENLNYGISGLPDKYPWRGTKADQNLSCVPCRVNIADKNMSARIEYLTEAVHGKRKCRIKFRD